jgi:hypothetical protein
MDQVSSQSLQGKRARTLGQWTILIWFIDHVLISADNDFSSLSSSVQDDNSRTQKRCATRKVRDYSL